ncbi:NACHT domain-containing protein [Streptomyces sp. NPDC048045]|uniref:NACHT domain-containing protein n=1 Tax=Streptomyces sp. NPDC048045 TaxID=3154710 RepID=UPI0034228821
MTGHGQPSGDTHNVTSGGQQGFLIQARDIVNLYVQPHVAVGVRGLVAGFGLYLLAVRPELPLPRGYDPGPVRFGWLLLALAVASGVAARVLSARRRKRDRAWQSPEHLQRVADGLADVLRWQYARDERLLHISEPHPIEVEWTPAGHNPRASVSEYFEGTPDRRLVVLGGAGAGKTVLALRLASELLEARAANSPRPVPLVVSLASWNPRRGLAQWLARQLAADCPQVCTPVPGVRPYDVALHLLRSTDRVLLILDGFDELPAARRKDALRQLGESLRGKPFALTSREDEYREHAPDPSVFTRTEIVLQSLTDDAVGTYLNPSGSDRSPWAPVLDRLRDTHDVSAETVRLREVLRVPLMAGLARVAYGWDGNHPRELLSHGRFTEEGALERHLYDAFLDTAYSASHDIRAEHGGWEPDDARRWVGFLAARMKAANEQDFAWWRLQEEMPWPVRGLCLAPSYLLLVLLVAWTGVGVAWWGARPSVWAAFALVCLLTLYGFAADPEDERTSPWRVAQPTGTQVRTALRAWKVRAVAAASVLTAGAAVAAAVAHWWVVAGCCVLVLGAQLQPVVLAVWRFADPAAGLSPKEVLHADRRLVLTLGWLAPLRLGKGDPGVSLYPLALPPMLFTVWQWTGRGPHVATPLDWAFAVAATLLAWWLYAAGFSAWGRYNAARVWLAATGRLPWRLTAFLQDAHARGVLRQAGGVYRFQHIELRNRLAEAYDTGESRLRTPMRAPFALSASLCGGLALFVLFFSAAAAEPPPDPVASAPEACSLLDGHEMRQVMTDGTKSSSTKTHFVMLPGLWPGVPGGYVCIASEQSPFAPDVEIGTAAVGWKSTKQFNGVRYATEQFRTIGKQRLAKGEQRLAGLGDEAAELVKKDWFGMSAMGAEPWQAMVRVRVGNALFVVTYAEEFAGRERTREIAEILMRDFLRRAGLDDSGGGHGTGTLTASRRRLADVPRAEIPKQGTRLVKYTRIPGQSVYGATWKEKERSYLWATWRLPFAFRAPKPLFCLTGGEGDLFTYKCDPSAMATAAGLVPDIRILIASNLGCGASCHERDADAYEHALLKYGTPRWTSIPLAPARGTADYAQETRTVGQERRYAMYLRRSFVWHSKGRQLTWRVWVKVDVPVKHSDLAQKVVNDIFTQSGGRGRATGGS